MKILNRYTNEVILEVPGETLENADLEGADLRDANLWHSDLRGANLWHAYLRGANFQGADLRGANLRGADLWSADLWCADLRGADLWGADLRDANLWSADLWSADLRGADLRGADLWGADLEGADLRDANLRDANLRDAKLSNYSICPEVGSFIGYKKASGEVVKLEIPIEAKRVSTPTSKKCRAEFVRVLSISNGLTRVESDQGNVIYRVGDLAYPDSFNEDIRLECTNGIHFFMTEKEAEDW